MSRPRGPDYEKNLAKRLRKEAREECTSDEPLCFACGIPLLEDTPNHRPCNAGDKIICECCDDTMQKMGYLQMEEYMRLYPDGSLRPEHWEIHDILTGRVANR